MSNRKGYFDQMNTAYRMGVKHGSSTPASPAPAVGDGLVAELEAMRSRHIVGSNRWPVSDDDLIARAAAHIARLEQEIADQRDNIDELTSCWKTTEQRERELVEGVEMVLQHIEERTIDPGEDYKRKDINDYEECLRENAMVRGIMNDIRRALLNPSANKE